MGGREKKLVWLIAAVLAVAMLIAGLTGFVRDEAAWSRFCRMWMCIKA